VKQLRPVSLALAVLALCTWSAASTACDQNKAKTTNATAASMKAADGSSCSPTKASAVTAGYTAKTSAKTAAAGHACTAEMAANCTPEMAAACAAHKGVSATTANVKGSKMSADCCMGKATKASATTAAVVGGPAKNFAVNAGAEGCAGHSAKTTAVMAGAGGSCSSKSAGAKATGHTAHGACDGCADFNDCDQTLRNMGAALQVVPLKNGVMYVYTSDASKARQIQSTMSQRKDQMAMFASASSGSALCGDCKQLRGAAMSGKLSREVVNIEGGCLTLMTSSDPAVVSRIHALAGVAASGRAKI